MRKIFLFFILFPCTCFCKIWNDYEGFTCSNSSTNNSLNCINFKNVTFDTDLNGDKVIKAWIKTYLNHNYYYEGIEVFNCAQFKLGTISTILMKNNHIFLNSLYDIENQKQLWNLTTPIPGSIGQSFLSAICTKYF